MDGIDVKVVPWVEVEPLGPANGDLGNLLANVDTFRRAWADFIAQIPADEFADARRRSLRRHAVETGIIERLYDVSWGVTEALVAEGLTLDVAEREGGIDEHALASIRAQFDALEFLGEWAREGNDLSVWFVRRLHELITRHQAAYEGHDALGRVVQLPLRHGQWKMLPNHVIREDGTQLQYTPPEQVQSQMEELVRLFEETGAAHPLVRAAWLHHRFIRIHPFEDGNGRVARALVLLVLLRADYAPLVVDRNRRGDYIDALEEANDGDLRPLIRLFAQLETVALVSELRRPALAVTVGEGPAEVARAYATRIRDGRQGVDQDRSIAVAALASEIQGRIVGELERLGSELVTAFRGVDQDAHRSVVKASPPEPDARFWYAQIVRAAQAGEFFANLAEGSWWVRLRLVVLGNELRFVVATQKVGHGETGVLAVTVFSEFVPPRSDDQDERSSATALFDPTSADHVSLNREDRPDERWGEICELIERTLTVSVAEYGRLLG